MISRLLACSLAATFVIGASSASAVEELPLREELNAASFFDSVPQLTGVPLGADFDDVLAKIEAQSQYKVNVFPAAIRGGSGRHEVELATSTMIIAADHGTIGQMDATDVITYFFSSGASGRKLIGIDRSYRAIRDTALLARDGIMATVDSSFGEPTMMRETPTSQSRRYVWVDAQKVTDTEIEDGSFVSLYERGGSAAQICFAHFYSYIGFQANQWQDTHLKRIRNGDVQQPAECSAVGLANFSFDQHQSDLIRSFHINVFLSGAATKDFGYIFDGMRVALDRGPEQLEGRQLTNF